VVATVSRSPRSRRGRDSWTNQKRVPSRYAIL